jgi:hypothetical protein
MRKAILLSFLVALISLGSFAQTNYDTISVTYTLGNIGTSHLFRYDGDTSPCPGYMNVPVPNNSIVAYVDVQYEMTASSPQRMSDQRSQLWCTSPGGTKEPEVYKGTGWSAGTMQYERTGLDIAFGIKPIFGLGVDFQLHAGSSNYYSADTCNDEFNRVNDSTWTLSVVYLPAGSPDFPSNPTPNDGAQLVSVTPELTWDFGDNSETYDLYLDTINPPVNKVVENGVVAKASGSYLPDTLKNKTTYYWKVVSKNDVNENPGVVWSFSTNCGDLCYPYYENFDEVVIPDLPDCWIAATDSEFNTIKTFSSSSNSHSAPNYVKFLAEEPNPQMVLVLPKVNDVSQMVLTLWGKNSVNWNNGEPYTFPFEIGTITDPFDYSTFEAFASFVPGKSYTYNEVYFNTYTGTDQYIAIRADIPQYAALYLDDVTLDYIPSCVKPLYLELDSITASSATISWTDLIEAPAKWEIQYDTTGFTLGEGTVVEVTTNPATITGLLDGASYDVYARSICGEGDTSNWSLPLTILTDCLPKDLPIVEDFGETPPYPLLPELPVCWSEISMSSSPNAGLFFTNYNSHTGEAIVFEPDGDAASQLLLVSPEIAPSLNIVQASFWAAKSTNTEGGNLLIVGTITDPTDYTTFTAYDTISLTEEYKYYTLYFTSYEGDDSYIAWKHNSEQYPSRKLFLDDIEIQEVASCIIPIDPEITSISQNSVGLAWGDINGATNWEIQVGDHGFVPGVDEAHIYYYNDVASDGNLATEVKGLDAGVVYDVYIRTLCGDNDYSDWASPLTFMTSLEYAELPATETFENGMGITVNQWDNSKDWELNQTLFVSDSTSIMNVYGGNQVNALIFGSFDLSTKSDAILSFYQIAKTDGNYDHCYVEISVDGGNTFTILPASTYLGHGVYTEKGKYNNPEGPMFDEDSYPEWGTGYQTPDNSWWKKEYFDLSSYAGNSNVVLRFRLVTNNFANKAGWFLDDISVFTRENPEIVVDPTSITKTIMEDVVEDVEMTISNPSNTPLQYTAKVVYDEQVLINENFDNGIPDTWTVMALGTNDTTWRIENAYMSYYSFNGTPFAFCNGTKDFNEVDSITDGVMLTPVVDASAYLNKGLRIEFDQAFGNHYQKGDTAQVWVYDGEEWVKFYEMYDANDGRLAYNQNGVHKVYDLSQYANENFQLKFRYVVGAGSRGYYFAIDNFKLRASLYPLGWLTINGSEVVNGFGYPDSDNIGTNLTVSLNPAGIPYDTFTAEIQITSDDPVNPTVTIPVTLTVQGIEYNVNLVFNDEEGNPLDNVKVGLGDEVVYTGADGVASFVNFVSGDYQLCAKKSGYGPIDQTLTVDHADINDTLVMLNAYNMVFWFTHEGVALDGVEVTVNNQTLVADMDGFAMFEDLVPGVYDYTASLEGYLTTTGSVPIVNGDVNVIVEMASEPHNVTFVCQYDGNPLEGVDVTVDGVTVTTDADGMATINDLFPGVYSYTADKDGYIPVYGTFEIADQDITVTVPMELITYSVSYYCLEDGNPVQGVNVTMNGIAIQSDENGLALFNDVVPGNYGFSVEKDGYFLQFGYVDVVDMDVDVTINMKAVTYTYTFHVNDGYKPINGAKVEFNGMAQFTNANGEAVFTGVAPGVYNYSISLNGYDTYQNTVVASGDVTEQDFVENQNVNATMMLLGVNGNIMNNVAVYPNPARNIVNIDNAQNATLKLVDLSGKTILVEDINTLHSTINVSSLPAGVYFIYLATDEAVSTHKIVVTK